MNVEEGNRKRLGGRRTGEDVDVGEAGLYDNSESREEGCSEVSITVCFTYVALLVDCTSHSLNVNCSDADTHAFRTVS